MSLDMEGTIDDVFESVPATRTGKTNVFGDDGRPVVVKGAPNEHKVTIQALSNKELQSLSLGAERTNDIRKIYVNDGDLYSIDAADEWTFLGITGTFRTIALDNRPWRNYCRAIVALKDE